MIACYEDNGRFSEELSQAAQRSLINYIQLCILSL